MTIMTMYCNLCGNVTIASMKEIENGDIVCRVCKQEREETKNGG